MKNHSFIEILCGWPAVVCGIGLPLAFGITSSSGAVAPTGPLSSARYGHTATLLPSGKVLVTGGQGNSGALASAEVYNPSVGTWTNAGALLAPARFPTATLLLNGKVLVAGGVNDGGSLARAQLYDPASGTWVGTGPLITPRFWHTANLLPNGKVLVVGGVGGNVNLASAELYDPASGIWAPANPMITARTLHTATLLTNGDVLLVGGQDSAGVTAKSELFNPATGLWTATSPMRLFRDTHTASLLPGGKVLVAGGWGGAYRSSVEVYDPGTGLWSDGVGMSTARGYHGATVLPGGNLLVSAGQDDFGALATAQMFNPSMAAWTVPTPLLARREQHTETLLLNGKVLLTGGHRGDYTALASAELWDSTGTTFQTNTALSLALDDPALAWITGGDAAWSGVSSTTHDGVDAAQSGSLFDNQISWLQTTVTGPGTLTFWWKVSSEANFDWLRFHLDGVLQQQISGEVNWQQSSFPLAQGSHTLSWRYVRDSNGTAGQDRAWLDQVSFTLASGAPVIVVQPANQIAWAGAKVTLDTVTLGASPLTQQWFVNATNAIANATNASLVLDNILPAQAGLYHIVVSNALGSATSSVATVTLTNNNPVSQVLLFSDSLVASPFEPALANLGQSFQRYSTEAAFDSAVNTANRSSTLAIVDAPQGFYAFSSLASFINGGGRVLIQAYSFAGSPTLAATFDVVIENRSVAPLPLHDWSGSSLLAGLTSPVNFKEFIEAFSLSEDAQRLHPLNGARPVAGFTGSPASGEGAIIIGNGGRTIANGFYVEGATSSTDAIRLAQNEIAFLIGAVGAPRVASQPQDRYAAIGATAVFKVTATGSRPLTFQWRKEGQPISGANATNYTITGVQSNNFGSYDVVVNNSFGATTSRVATLDLAIPPTVLQAPLSQSVVVGAGVTFSVEISGYPPPFTYEWRKTSVPLFTNSFSSNDRFSFFTISNVTAAHAGNYRVVIRNSIYTNGVAPPQFTLTVLPDTDGDGLPDDWESAYHLTEAGADEDGDGFTNLEEYNAGTNPTNAASRLRIEGITPGAQMTLSFEASSNKTYTAQSSAILGGSWTRVADVVARATNHTVTVTDTITASTSNRFYRVVTPRQP